MKNLIECPTCNGSGEQTIIAKMLTKKGWHNEPPVIMSCIRCDGSGKVDPIKIAKEEKASKDFWCECDNHDAGSTYVDDGVSSRCSKHHYVCNVCNKITQIG